jgi:glyoxylase-like metal-dependent hydrolase (beta-lactamase superfamily II)
LALVLGVTPGPPADILLEEGDEVRFGNISLKILHTPGHTSGGISLLGEGAIFTGDALFNMGIGRTDLPGGDFQTLIESIKTKLFTLPEETVVYPGHGPATTIDREKRTNPFVP